MKTKVAGCDGGFWQAFGRIVFELSFGFFFHANTSLPFMAAST